MGPERTRTIAALVAAAALVVIVLVAVVRPGSEAGPGGSPSAVTPSAVPSATIAPTGTAASPSAGSSTTAPSATATPSASASATPQPTATPTASPTPSSPAQPAGRDLSGTWMGTWTNEATWSQQGTALDGTIVFDSPCNSGTTVQGTVSDPQVEFHIVGRDKVAFTGIATRSRIAGTFTSSCDSSEGTFELSFVP
jgi:hypothetical protein